MNAFQIAEVQALLRRRGIHNLMKIQAGKKGIIVSGHLDDPRAQNLRVYHIVPQREGDFACWIIGGSYNTNRGDTPAQALERTMTSPRSW